MTGVGDLAGLGVLVTRPVHQAETLCRLIEDHGGRPVRYPALEILPPLDRDAARELVRGHWDLAIYISPNAARLAVSFTGGYPRAACVGAVGQGTARALQQAGVGVDLLPERFDSEGLLALPELRDAAGKRVLIVRGEGGRPLLGDTLTARGARVSYAEVYRRAAPVIDPAPLLARWQRDVQVVTATSPDILQNLFAMLGDAGRPLLCATPLVVISERMEQSARRLGVQRIIRAGGADDETLLKALRNGDAGLSA